MDLVFNTRTDDLSGRPCDKNGVFIPKDAPPPPREARAPDDYSPFNNRTHFEAAEFCYTRAKLSAKNVNLLSILWAASLARHKDSAPLRGAKSLYETIDSIPLGGVAWNQMEFTAKDPEEPDDPKRPWKSETYEVIYRDPCQVVKEIIANPSFDGEFDYTPKREHLPNNAGLRRKDFMSGDWAWDQATKIAKDPQTDGAMFVPVILSTDKTTVSVATGQNEYYPVYASIGNVHNNVRRAHRNAVVVIGFLNIPKASKECEKDAEFLKFRRQLVHTSLAAMLETLKPGMEVPDIVRCADGHFRKAIYGIGPYIADYPEQALIACVVQGWCAKCTAEPPDLDSGGDLRWKEHTEAVIEQLQTGEAWDSYGIVNDIMPFTNDFPRADIHELLSPDLLHQLIKGTFKDHLVSWVEDYLEIVHGEEGAKKILTDIDNRIASAPPFSNLRRFPEGRGFKQWTGDDSKALMKVWLPAIVGYVPSKMVKAIAAFLDFCYLARRNVHTPESLDEMDDALRRFHRNRVIFQTTGVRPKGFALPRQHSLVHYRDLIVMFGAPNGLCSSITESKHIKAVKEPYRRSNKYKPLKQIAYTNQRLDKLAALRVDLESRGMLEGSKGKKQVPPLLEDPGDVEGPTVHNFTKMARTPQRQHPRDLYTLAAYVNQPRLPELTRRFLYDQTRRAQARSELEIPLSECPKVNGPVHVYHSAAATYYAPSDACGVGGMHREHIRATPSWYGGDARFDVVLTEPQSGSDSINGLSVARTKLLFSFRHKRIKYNCALVHWYEIYGNAPDVNTGMWTLRPQYHDRRHRNPHLTVIRLDTVLRAAHLMPCFGRSVVKHLIRPHHSLDRFKAFYLNKYADHHAYEVTS
ncbi:hypothetical protein CERSUDRAFT_52595 [Gelatoporia subvermispora B]|uniref:Uncharacterized protein n=1 Tax=Ceriporiopsis subvermispora (strain B) TaxID=914234 RepID=M2QWD8_CERS8|nr:hypothetical protein CERSUDRAFT_52595 [Gelatoporia subvermispora B]